jgi:hypothetical protein
LRLLIHVPLREKRDFRRTLVGFKHALCVSQAGAVTSYDLLPSFKPQKGQEHRLVLHLAEQVREGWTLAVWDVERVWRELQEVVDRVSAARPKLKAHVDGAWHLISNAEEEIVDLKAFERLPMGHFLSMIAFREDIDFDAYPPRRRRRLLTISSRRERPVCEDFWCVLAPLLMAKSEAERAGGAYRRWVQDNRPRPPRADMI